MGILGIGTDILDISRIHTILSGPTGTRFVERVLTPKERELFFRRKNKAEFLAGRFAGKEAVAKAFGTGIGRGVGFQDLEILPDSMGKPVCRLSDAAVLRLGLNSSYKVHLSISHSDTTAAAFAVIEVHDSPTDRKH